MSDDDRGAVQRTNDALRDVPPLDRLAAICASIIHEEPRAPFAICVLIEVATMLTKHLPPSQQTCVAWHLQSALEELRTKWH